VTDEMLKKLWDFRREGLQEVVQNPTRFKECEQCRSISVKKCGICARCHSYRFKEDVEVVLATVEEMAKHPYPVYAAVVPRINWKSL